MPVLLEGALWTLGILLAVGVRRWAIIKYEDYAQKP
jgi:hypothetical protein